MLHINFYLSIILLSFLFIGFTPASAEEKVKNQEYESLSTIPEYLISKIHQNIYREQYVVNILNDLRRFDPSDGNTITIQKIKEKEDEIVKVAIRGQITQMLEYDVNVDGKITLEELETTLSKKYEVSETGQSRVKKITNELLKLDENQDKIISFDEMKALHPDKINNQVERFSKKYREILALAEDKKSINSEELTGLALKAFNTVDKNRDSKISQTEYEPIKTKMVSMRANYTPFSNKSSQSCIFPELEDDYSLISINLYSGEAISSVTTAGQSSETTAVDVKISEDMKPTYLILSSHRPIIFNFSGDSKNLKNLVVYNRLADENGKSTVGIVGIPKEKITFLAGNCLPRYDQSSGMGGLSMKNALSKALGRNPDKMYGGERYEKIEISSEDVNLIRTKVGPFEKREAPKGYDPQVWSRHTIYFPAGVKEIDPNSVISLQNAEQYEILPHSAGIAKLVSEGKMEIIKLGTYRILEDLPRYPAGLGGGHAVNFIIAEGVTPPEGRAGHSCVRLEETGEVVSGSLCR